MFVKNLCITKFKQRGVEILPECKISGGKSSIKETRLSILHNKIKKHLSSTAHQTVCTTIIDKETNVLTNKTIEIHKSTKMVFRTAYFIAKNIIEPMMTITNYLNYKSLMALILEQHCNLDFLQQI